MVGSGPMPITKSTRLCSESVMSFDTLDFPTKAALLGDGNVMSMISHLTKLKKVGPLQKLWIWRDSNSLDLLVLILEFPQHIGCEITSHAAIILSSGMPIV